jgi:hypothetical protein
VVYAAHVAEEAPGFTAWARRNASERYTQGNFVRNNLLELASTTAATLVVTRRRNRPLDLAYYALVVTQQAALNAVFHTGATLAFREYSPGLATSILTVPLSMELTRAAIADGRLTRREVTAGVALAGVVHAVVAARQVFFVGVPAGR